MSVAATSSSSSSSYVDPRSLLVATQKPVKYKTFDFGGDDTYKGTDVSVGEIYARCLKHNAAQREAVIACLGGREAVAAMPIIDYPGPLTDYSHYMNELEDVVLPAGCDKAQGEDDAGRKFAVLRIQDLQSGETRIGKVFQRYRETCLDPTMGMATVTPESNRNDGCRWVFTLRSDVPYVSQFGKELDLLVKGEHPKYRLAPQPAAPSSSSSSATASQAPVAVEQSSSSSSSAVALQVPEAVVNPAVASEEALASIQDDGTQTVADATADLGHLHVSSDDKKADK